jgi:hypothetical protein
LFTTTADIYTPIVTDVSFAKTLSKSELVAGGFQVIRGTDDYVKIDRVSTSPMLQVGGAITATGNITAYSSSDIRWKENILRIDSALDKIQKINGIEFDWTDKYLENEYGSSLNQLSNLIKKHDIGIIAQEVEEVLPEVVTTRTDGYKAVRYEKLVALLIEGIKELKKEIDILKNKS